MRQILFVGLVGLVAIATPISSSLARTRAPAASAAPSDLYCLQGRIWGYPGNCQFSTYQQCTATASGTDAYCDVNPQYLFGGPRRSYWSPR